jgi:hypothetical protein
MKNKAISCNLIILAALFTFYEFITQSYFPRP